MVYTVRSPFISNSFATYVSIFHDDDDDDDDDDININIRQNFLSEICALLTFNGAYTGSFLTKFRGKLWFPSLRVKGCLKMAPTGCPETS